MLIELNRKFNRHFTLETEDETPWASVYVDNTDPYLGRLSNAQLYKIRHWVEAFLVGVTCALEHHITIEMPKGLYKGQPNG